MNIQDVLREMREVDAVAPSDDVACWADALEAAMREPVAWCFTDVNGKPKELTDSPDYRDEQDKRIYTPLYALPPDAAGEIEREEMAKMRLIGQCADQLEEIERLEKERDLWREEARRLCENTEHWRQEVDKKDAEIKKLREALWFVVREVHRGGPVDLRLAYELGILGDDDEVDKE